MKMFNQKQKPNSLAAKQTEPEYKSMFSELSNSEEDRVKGGAAPKARYPDKNIGGVMYTWDNQTGMYVPKVLPG